MKHEIQLRYKWRREPYGVHGMWHGFDGERRFGVISRMPKSTSHDEYWQWNMSAAGVPMDPRIETMAGRCASGRLAASLAEDCYERVFAGTWPGITPSDLEAIAEWEREVERRRATPVPPWRGIW